MTRQNLLLALSLGCNIFLAAFILGRATALPHGPFPPPFMHDRDGRDAPPPPPPFAAMQSLFTPEEEDRHHKKMCADIDRTENLRAAFIAKLQAGPVKDADVRAYLDETDRAMRAFRDDIHAEVVKKIAALDAEGRQDLAARLGQSFPMCENKDN